MRREVVVASAGALAQRGLDTEIGRHVFRAVDIQSEQVEVGPVSLVAQLEDLTTFGRGAVALFELEVLAPPGEIPESGLGLMHAGVAEGQVDLVITAAQVLHLAVFAIDQHLVVAGFEGDLVLHHRLAAFTAVVHQRHGLAVEALLRKVVMGGEFPDQNLWRVVVKLLAGHVLQQRAVEAAATDRAVKHFGAAVLLQESGEVVGRAAVAGTDQGNLRVGFVAEQAVAVGLTLHGGLETRHILGGVGGAAEMCGGFVQGAGLGQQAGDVAFELLLGNLLEPRDFLERCGHQLGGTVGSGGCPVMVGLEVVVGVYALFVEQRGQVGGPDPCLAKAFDGLEVVLLGLLEIELGFFLGGELFAVYQAARRLINDQQFHAFALECIAQSLELSVASGRSAKVSAQVITAAKQPVTFALHQGGEKTQVLGVVLAGVLGGGAQRADPLYLILRFGLCASGYTQQGAGEGQLAEFERLCVHVVVPQSWSSAWLSTGSISTASWRRTIRSRISSCLSPRMPLKLMPVLLLGASISTRYSSTDSGESMDSGPEPLPARVPPTTIIETSVSKGSSWILRSVLERSLMCPYTPLRPLAAATFSYRRIFRLLRRRMPWRALFRTWLPHSRLSELS